MNHFYHRLAGFMILTIILATGGFVYFFLYPPLNPDNRLYFITPRIESLARRLDFVLRSTAISQTTFTSEQDIVGKVLASHQVALGEALPLIPARSIKKELEALPMVLSATVVVHYPSRQLRINFVERQPLAVLSPQNKIITLDGRLLPLPSAGGDKLKDIMRVRSEAQSEAEEARLIKNFFELYNGLQAYSLLLDIVREAQFVGGRRWRLFLARPLGHDDLLVELPENLTTETLARLSKLILVDKILDLKIAKLDLRLENQTLVRLLSPNK